MNLFAYGTLMCADIMHQVAGCLPDHAPASLAHYQRRRVSGEEYPAIIGQQGAAVQGVVYLDVQDTAWRRLDRFEGEMYDRRTVRVDCADGTCLAADTSVIRPEFAHLLLTSEWSYDQFLRSGFVGHGVGLAIDEYPVLARGFDLPLEQGMVWPSNRK